MSINHISTDLQETLWWQLQQQPMNMEPTQDSPSSTPHKTPQQYPSWPSHLYHHHHHHQLWLNSYNSQTQNHNPTHTFNLNQEDTVLDEQDLDDHSTTNTNQEPPQAAQHHHHHHLEKEAMFEKPLTPSDVGKLNRLVIPKQHAEKYFPLGGDSGDKGLLLSFEDESGKCWRFRYSYWNSSQSYVLTKGWSRYVKEKRLDAGDVIQFERDRRDRERLFIGWRRRGTAGSSCGGGGGGGWSRGHPYPVQVQNHGVTVPYQPADCLHAGSVVQNQVANPVGNSRRLRLFGVNLECQLDESELSTPDDGLSFSSQSQPHHHYYSHYPSNRDQTHMDITLSEDVNQMRNRQG